MTASFSLLKIMSISSIPAATASSMTYWITGRSTSGISSLGTDFEKGRKRVPKPAAGMTALRIDILFSLFDDAGFDEFNGALGELLLHLSEHFLILISADDSTS